MTSIEVHAKFIGEMIAVVLTLNYSCTWTQGLANVVSNNCNCLLGLYQSYFYARLHWWRKKDTKNLWESANNSLSRDNRSILFNWICKNLIPQVIRSWSDQWPAPEFASCYNIAKYGSVCITHIIKNESPNPFIWGFENHMETIWCNISMYKYQSFCNILRQFLIFDMSTVKD